MSSLEARNFIKWISSKLDGLSAINGAFSIYVHKTLMVSQSIDLIREQCKRVELWSHFKEPVKSFYSGALNHLSLGDKPNMMELIWTKSFSSPEKLKAFNIQELLDATKLLELHFDIAFIVADIHYKTNNDPVLVTYIREPLGRGVSFKVEERGQVHSTLQKGIELTPKGALSHRHYSTGMTLLSLEDQISGLLDGAFMQFYLSCEALLESHKIKSAVQSGKDLYGDEFPEEIVRHVYMTRQRFFGHAHNLNGTFNKSSANPEIAFKLSKQVLVARWCARKLLSLELKSELAIRELDFFSGQICASFNGDASSLKGEFKLP